jgi:hypothetical protein
MNISFDNRAWNKDHYKLALKMAHVIPKREQHQYDELLEKRIKDLPIRNLQQYFSSLSTSQFHLIPYRVNGHIENQAEHELWVRSDIWIHSFTLFSKYAFATLFVWEMSDTRVSKEPFVQISIERIYSQKKGNGAKLIQHLMKKAVQNDVVLTMWNENEKLKDYFVEQGFTYEYKSLSTGHYFMTYNLQMEG